MLNIYKNKKDIPQSTELIEMNDYFFNHETDDYEAVKEWWSNV